MAHLLDSDGLPWSAFLFLNCIEKPSLVVSKARLLLLVLLVRLGSDFIHAARFLY